MPNPSPIQSSPGFFSSWQKSCVKLLTILAPVSFGMFVVLRDSQQEKKKITVPFSNLCFTEILALTSLQGWEIILCVGFALHGCLSEFITRRKWKESHSHSDLKPHSYVTIVLKIHSALEKVSTESSRREIPVPGTALTECIDINVSNPNGLLHLASLVWGCQMASKL